jgi:hypothetical protein
VKGLTQVNFRETIFDVKCGLIRSISRGQTTDELYGVKLALAGSVGRKNAGNVATGDDAFGEDFVEKAYLRLWTNAASEGRYIS